MDPPNGIPKPGQTFESRYHIDGFLGEGGMGVVLRATHALTETQVAIKLLHPELAGQSSSIARFLREARNAAAVRSEHVGQVLDVALTESGLPYIVMEFVPGEDLGTICQSRGMLPVDEAATYVLQACVPVAEAHALGIVHRDLKPPNFFLTSRADGSPLIKVFDFGISKRSGEEHEDTQTLTQTGVALGTPCYMAPEQIADAKNVDERADVWSLGAMLYEMLAGKLPFGGDTPASVLSAVTTSEPAPLSQLRPDIPPELAALVHGCLKKPPGERIKDVPELARGLGPFVPAEFRSLVRRVACSRYPAADRSAHSPARSEEAFRRALAEAAPTSASSPPGDGAPAAPVSAPAPAAPVSAPPPVSAPGPASVRAAAPASVRAVAPASVRAPLSARAPASVRVPVSIPAPASGPAPASAPAPAPVARAPLEPPADPKDLAGARRPPRVALYVGVAVMVGVVVGFVLRQPSPTSAPVCPPGLVTAP